VVHGGKCGQSSTCPAPDTVLGLGSALNRAGSGSVRKYGDMDVVHHLLLKKRLVK
jgi:hypothetical protein